jgi:hypothetical protein
VRVVQEGFDLVQGDLEAGAVRGFDVGAEMRGAGIRFRASGCWPLGGSWKMLRIRWACLWLMMKLPIIQVPSFYAARKITSGKDDLQQRQAEQGVAGRNKVVGHDAEAVLDVVSK